MPACRNHPDAPAGWRCPTHGPLCPACTGVRPAGYGRLEACAQCEGLVERLRAPRRLLHPLSSVLLTSLWFPLQKSGLVTLLASALVLRALFFFGTLAGLFGLGVIVAHLFHVVRHAAAGGDDFPSPDEFRGLFDDVLGPLLRIALAGLWLVLPLLAWRLGNEHPLSAFFEALFGWGSVPLVPLVIFVVSALLLPMGLIASALKTQLRNVLLPAHLVLGPARLGVDYWLLSLFSLLCALAGLWAVHRTQTFFLHHPLPLSSLLVTLVGLYPAFVAFRAMGLLVRSRGDELGWGSPSDYLEPVLDAEPAVRLSAVTGRPHPVAIDLDEASVSPLHAQPEPEAGPAPYTVGALELDGPRSPPVWPLVTPTNGLPALAGKAAAPPSTTPRSQPRAEPRPPDQPAAPPAAKPASLPQRQAPSAALNSAPFATDPIAPGVLARLVTARDLDGAIVVLAESGRGIPAQTLSGQAWVDLAKACLAKSQPAGPESAKLAALGVLAYRRAAEVAPNGPLAPQAFLQAARLYDEVLGDRPRSDALLAELARRYPNTAEGQFAARRVAKA
jgi:hypothetical protein